MSIEWENAMKLDQHKAPILEALQAYRDARVVPFDVPGHKQGRGNPELLAFLGKQCLEADVNSSKPLDNLCHPVSVVQEAEELAADAFGAGHAFLMVNGTTSAVQSMVLSVCKQGEKLILPRNVHRSIINAMVLCGAVPVYVNPQINGRLGIALGMRLADVASADTALVATPILSAATPIVVNCAMLALTDSSDAPVSSWIAFARSRYCLASSGV